MSKISPEDRKLIDEAIAAGKVQKIPIGVSAFSEEIYYDQAEGKLKYKDPDIGKKRMQMAAGRQVQAVKERRIKARNMAREGVSAADAAQRLGVPVSTIHNDANALGFKFKRPSRMGQKIGVTKETAAFRKRVEAVFSVDKTAKEIADELEVDVKYLRPHLKAMGLTPKSLKGRNKSSSAKAAARRVEVKKMVEAGMNGPEISEALGISRHIVYFDCETLGITIKRRPPPGRTPKNKLDKVNQKKFDAASRKIEKLRDRRRNKIGTVATGDYSRLAPIDQVTTLFPDRVLDPTGDETVLMDGANSTKLGGDVIVGRLKGAKIYQVTLEERRTCPRSCAHFRGCYGNGMQYAKRFRHGKKLEKKLRTEIETAASGGRKILIRLHTLGDFYSPGYINFWRQILWDFPGVTTFGFTAWPETSTIGKGIDLLRQAFPDRFMIRRSGKTGVWGSFTLPFWTTEKTVGDAIVCPAQIDAHNHSERGTHCGNCAACWSTDRPIAFMRH